MSQTWDQAIQSVLRDKGRPMHYTDIADEIIKQGLRDSVGATPASTVNAMMNNHYPEPYVRLGEGIYALKTWIENQGAQSKEEITKEPELPDTETGAIKAFGMYWLRAQINWATPKLLGKQDGAELSVDFGNQIGVYLLHDRERVIYVGRAEDSLVKRLVAHTAGRFGGRWDRFSWFGIKPVDQSGKLAEAAADWTRHDVIETMEAVLIECLEPSQNRRRGDNLGENEFVQENDPEFKKTEARRLLEGLIEGI
jgi:hypothetical protein